MKELIPSTDWRLADIVYAVEATYTEYFLNWCDAFDRRRFVKSWKQIDTPFSHTICTVNMDGEDVPIKICIRLAQIDGRLVGFYESDSSVTDIRLVRRWMTENVPAYKKGNYCDTMNFNHCTQYIQGLNGRR